MTLGAGRIIDQDMTRISKALAEGAARTNPALQQAFDAAAGEGRTLHLLGLVSDGGVHSHQPHLEALLAHCKERGVAPAVHAFLEELGEAGLAPAGAPVDFIAAVSSAP